MNSDDGLQTLQGEVNEFLRSVPATTERFALLEALPEGELPSAPTIAHFSPFILEHVERAAQLTDRFMALADASVGQDDSERLRRVLQEARHSAVAENAELVQHAFMMFLTHHTQGRRLQIPSLEERHPEQVAPSKPIAARQALRAMGVTEAMAMATPLPGVAAATSPEDLLDWYREDILANEHHEHWHIVYPTAGVQGVDGVRRTKDRQGELFFYMHEQMLARYHAERLAVKLEGVRSLHDYRVALAEGYDPGPLFADYAARPPGLHLADLRLPDQGIPFYPLIDHELIRTRILNAVDSGFLQRGDVWVETTTDLLGAVEESTIGSVDRNFYRNHHGFGHVLIALCHDPEGSSPPGVMWSTATAIRDPIFYRWHKHVDDISFRWQQRQQPYNFQADAPPIFMRKQFDNRSPDIILCFRDQVPGADGDGFNGQTLGLQAFGGRNWNQEFVQGEFPVVDANNQPLTIATTDELQTKMFERDITLPDNSTQTVEYLNHREFFYFIRVRNTSAKPQSITVRIFLAPEAERNNRQAWIEMDKFRHDLGPQERAVIFRPAELSAVLRKPAIKDPANYVKPKPPEPKTTPEPKPPPYANADPQAEFYYCECGWPYNLLVPRGTKEGMRFWLMVMITDWEIDRVPTDSHCGSMSFCGAQDKYPDTRAMGYPFDRRFASPISDTIADHSNMAARPIAIRWTQDAEW